MFQLLFFSDRKRTTWRNLLRWKQRQQQTKSQRKQKQTNSSYIQIGFMRWIQTRIDRYLAFNTQSTTLVISGQLETRWCARVKINKFWIISKWNDYRQQIIFSLILRYLLLYTSTFHWNAIGFCHHSEQFFFTTTTQMWMCTTKALDISWLLKKKEDIK